MSNEPEDASANTCVRERGGGGAMSERADVSLWCSACTKYEQFQDMVRARARLRPPAVGIPI